MHQRVDTPNPRMLDREHRFASLGMITLVALGAFEAMAVTAAMPAVADALNGLQLYALAFALPLACSIVGMAVGGAISDSRGPRNALLGGVVIFALGLLIAGTAPSMGVLTVGRGVQGFGQGVYIVALYVLVAQRFPTQLRPRVFAAFAAAWVLPALVGPAIAGLIVDHVGWRWVFLSVPALAVLALIMQIVSLPGSTPDRGNAATSVSRIAWSVVAALAAVALHLAGQAQPPTALALGLLGAVGLFLSVPRLLPTGTSRLRAGLPAIVGTRGLIAGAFVAAEVFIPLLLNRERGLSPGTAGLALTASAVAWSIGSWLQGRDRFTLPRWRIGRYGLIFVAIGTASSAIVALPDVPVFVIAVTWPLAGLGMGLVMPILSVLTLSASAPGDEGRNSSALQISDALAATLALALTGTVFLALLEASGVLAYFVGFAIAATLAVVAAANAPRMAIAEE